MEETTQFNIRLSKSLVFDMEYIAQNLNMNRNDWLKYKIAELINEEKAGLMEKTEREFLSGRIDDEIFEKKMGFKPTTQLKQLKKKISEAPQKYISDLLKEIK